MYLQNGSREDTKPVGFNFFNRHSVKNLAHNSNNDIILEQCTKLNDKVFSQKSQQLSFMFLVVKGGFISALSSFFLI